MAQNGEKYRINMIKITCYLFKGYVKKPSEFEQEKL